jgi:hypothetical protein
MSLLKNAEIKDILSVGFSPDGKYLMSVALSAPRETPGETILMYWSLEKLNVTLSEPHSF